jgi:hypothetical protein
MDSFNFTYRNLLIALSKLKDEQLDSDITIYDAISDEYFKIRLDMVITNEDGLDPDHPVFGITNIE